MAVAAYASLLSLSHVLDNVHHPARLHLLSIHINHIQTLQEKVHFLQQFLEIYSQQRNSQEIDQDLARQITVVADEAENVIDLHVVDQLRCRSDEDLSSFCEDVGEVIQKFDSIKAEAELMMLVKEHGTDIQEQQPAVSVTPAAGSSAAAAPPSDRKNTMVGFDEHLVRLMEELTTDEASLKVISIVGMGGIGKTTLARGIFDHAYVVHHFHKRIWFTISQQYSVIEILQGLLNDGKIKQSNESVAELGGQLYKSLFRERYLIVMDDVWSAQAWDDLKLYFPDNGNGSRVMVTTRLLNLAIDLGSHNPYLMNFLNEEKSWNLLCQKVFGQQHCPYPELEEIGKDIANSCRGLPLAIAVIGGLLSKSNITLEYWKSIAENVLSLANSEDDESCLKILSLSYNNLPLHLKPCFLYVRVFREDEEISVSKLIKLWVAEGFIKPVRNKSLEEIAEEYLQDLIGRNLILILERRGKMKKCMIHDILRELCLRESHKEYFIKVPKAQHGDMFLGTEKKCFICGQLPTGGRIDLHGVILGSRSISIKSPLVCDACKIMYPKLMRLRLVKVWDGAGTEEKGNEFLQPTTLRYLNTGVFREVLSPCTMHLLWNLQTLFFDVCSFLPSEIWELMPQLRHLNVSTGIVLPYVRKESTVMVNLQTLSKIKNFRCSGEAVEKFPNLKKLKIWYDEESQSVDWSYYSLQNLVHFCKLETLVILIWGRSRRIMPENMAFPNSLKKLMLWNCKIPWEDMCMRKVGSLPNLEVLKLKYKAFQGAEWNPIEGEFLRLKVLLIHDCYLVRWRAEDFHFPSLEILELSYMDDLEEIPSSIGDIPTLHTIHLIGCRDSIIESANEIVEQQQSFENYNLHLHIEEHPCVYALNS